MELMHLALTATWASAFNSSQQVDTELLPMNWHEIRYYILHFSITHTI
jgi:hypothetical protein